jgi:hypothetical protein
MRPLEACSEYETANRNHHYRRRKIRSSDWLVFVSSFAISLIFADVDGRHGFVRHLSSAVRPLGSSIGLSLTQVGRASHIRGLLRNVLMIGCNFKLDPEWF